MNMLFVGISKIIFGWLKTVYEVCHLLVIVKKQMIKRKMMNMRLWRYVFFPLVVLCFFDTHCLPVFQATNIIFLILHGTVPPLHMTSPLHHSFCLTRCTCFPLQSEMACLITDRSISISVTGLLWSYSLSVLQLLNLYYICRYVCVRACVCVCVHACMSPVARQTAGPIWTKLGMGTWMGPGSVLGKVKVEVTGADTLGPRSNAEGERIEAPIGGWVRPEDG